MFHAFRFWLISFCTSKKKNLEHVGGVTDERHGDGLGLEVVVDGILALLTADTRLFVTTERRGVIENVVSVDPDGTGAERAGDAVDGVDVLGKDTGGESVVGVVATLDDVGLVLEFGHGHDGAEDFLLENLGGIRDIGEDGGLDVEALVVLAVTATGEFETLVLARLDVTHNALELHGVNLGTLISAVEGVTDLAGLGLRNNLLKELVVHVLMHEDARGGAAALAVVEEQSEVNLVDGFVEIDVGENDRGGLATELEGARLHADNLLDLHGGGDGTGEGELVDARVLGQRLASLGSPAGADVHDALRETGINEDLTKLESGHGGLLGGLEDDGAPGGKSGSELPGGHQEREIPGNNLTDDTDGLLEGVRKVLALLLIMGENFAVDLVGPAGVVAEMRSGKRDVGT